MRLLQIHRIHDRGDDESLLFSFSLVQYYRDIPPYAILSHTWLPADEEVTFQDISNHTGNDKRGVAKLHFCAQQAVRDGIGYIWVDTCCIDKTSSAELSEAINSMFRWYQKSVKCYVYLFDVHSSEYNADSRRFQASKWFTRGWTLQELLAPTCVEFFTRDMVFIGTRVSLSTPIIATTGIPNEALRGYPMHFFSQAERLYWALGRSTTREEDSAYSLLGILDVHMPLIYGEGESRALSRLLHEADIYEIREYGRAFRFFRAIIPSLILYRLKPYRRYFGAQFINVILPVIFMLQPSIQGTGPRVKDIIVRYANLTIGDLITWIWVIWSMFWWFNAPNGLRETPEFVQSVFQRREKTIYTMVPIADPNTDKDKED